LTESVGRAAAMFAARESYGRMVAYLARRWRDVAAAEDALASAFEEALRHWPTEGVPEAPDRWLLSVAHRKLTDQARHTAVRGRPDVVAALAAEATTDLGAFAMPDDRLRLMLVCAHPAIDTAVRPALILQLVLGLDVKAMAPLFVLPEATLNKRLVRAKAKIRDAGLRFEEPEPADLPLRVSAVLEALYAAYVSGADREDGVDLRSEALELARIVQRALPEDAEVLGCAALLAFCEARRPAFLGACVDTGASLVPLDEQDPSRWDTEWLARGFAALSSAAARGAQPGPFQLEAAIQGAHCYRARSGVTPWSEIVTLYDRLLEIGPTLGAHVGRAIAGARATGSPALGLAHLDGLAADERGRYQPYWLARAYLSELEGARQEARVALDRALELTRSSPQRRFIEAWRTRLIDA
jgi:RNA polymerase sigma-70 factor, ECF subfamily